MIPPVVTYLRKAMGDIWCLKECSLSAYRAWRIFRQLLTEVMQRQEDLDLTNIPTEAPSPVGWNDELEAITIMAYHRQWRRDVPSHMDAELEGSSRTLALDSCELRVQGGLMTIHEACLYTASSHDTKLIFTSNCGLGHFWLAANARWWNTWTMTLCGAMETVVHVLMESPEAARGNTTAVDQGR